MPEIVLGGQNYPSFISAESATIYLAGDIMRAALWTAANEDAQKRGLISATRMLVALPWVDPVPDPVAAEADIPDVVEQVTAMLAADLVAKPKLFADATGNSNVKSVKAGSAAVEFFRPVEGGPAIPTAFWRMLLTAGLVSGASEDPDFTAGALVTGISGGCRPLYGRPSWEYPVAALDHD